MSAVNEALIRDVVAEVLCRLGQPAAKSSVAPGKDHCGCGNGHVSGGSIRSGKHGVFQDAEEACAAAHGAFLQLKEKGMAARAKVVEIVKTLAEANAQEWGRIELEETKIGRLDHKIEKLKIIKLVPGVEWLHPDASSGDHGITLEEYTPFGVVAAITPSTHSIPTLSGNVVNIVAAGNAVVFNAHPAVVQAAMESGKRAICAGPGNPPVFVDDTACLKRAANAIIQGASYDNNLLCIGEKEVFVLDPIADQLMSEMEKNGAVRLNASQLETLTKAAFTFKADPGGGGPHASVNRDFIGKDPSVLAKVVGANLPSGTPLLF